MMLEDNEKLLAAEGNQKPPATEVNPTPPATEDNQKQLTLPHFFVEKPTADSNKRKYIDQNSHQTPSKIQKRQERDGDGNQMKVLNQILGKMLSLETKLNNIETVVTNLKDEILIREVPIDTEKKLDTLLSDMDTIKNKCLVATSEPEVMSTQAALEATAFAMDTDNNDAEGTQPVLNISPVEVIGDWEEYLTKRKFGFNKHLTNEGKHKFHVGWKTQEPPFIPAEYLPKEMRFSESEREYELRRKQKYQSFEAYIELLGIRRDEGLVDFTSVDTHIEETINESIVDVKVKDTLKAEYQKRIKADEKGYLKKWEQVEKGLKERPERETVSKIVIVNDRVYAKGRSNKKDKKPDEANKSLEKPKVSKVSREKQPVKNTATNSKEKQWTKTDKKRPARRQWSQPNYSYQQPHFSYQQPIQVYQQPMSYQYPVPLMSSNMERPPPSVPALSARQPENPSVPFQWSNQDHRWTHLNPNALK